MKKTVLVSETQPITAEGLRALLAPCTDLEFLRALDSLQAGLEIARRNPPAVWVLDKAFGAQPVMDALAELKSAGLPVSPVIWGASMTEAEVLRFMQAGARGIIRKCAPLDSLLTCLHSVAGGATWMEQVVFHETPRVRRNRAGLTERERQVVELVGLGMKNREVAAELGIRPGTVKVHLKHIFEKTGVQGRYGLALSGLASAAVG